MSSKLNIKKRRRSEVITIKMTIDAKTCKIISTEGNYVMVPWEWEGEKKTKG